MNNFPLSIESDYIIKVTHYRKAEPKSFNCPAVPEEIEFDVYKKRGKHEVFIPLYFFDIEEIKYMEEKCLEKIHENI